MLKAAINLISLSVGLSVRPSTRFAHLPQVQYLYSGFVSGKSNKKLTYRLQVARLRQTNHCKILIVS